MSNITLLRLLLLFFFFGGGGHLKSLRLRRGGRVKISDEEEGSLDIAETTYHSIHFNNLFGMKTKPAKVNRKVRKLGSVS